jgi:hypothetical protein
MVSCINWVSFLHCDCHYVPLKLKNMVHALLTKRIRSGVKDGLVTGGGKNFLPGWDISSGGIHKKARRCSDKSGLWQAMVENKGVEPLTLCVQGRCSDQLS